MFTTRAGLLLLVVLSSCPMIMVETRGRLTYIGDAEDCQKCLEDQIEGLRALEQQHDLPPLSTTTLPPPPQKKGK